MLTDPVFTARAEGKADAIHGGNDLSDKFTSDWMGADGSPAEGFYVQARGGKNFSANESAQHKISRYAPDGAGGYRSSGARGARRWNGRRDRANSTAACASRSRSTARQRGGPVALRHRALHGRGALRGLDLPDGRMHSRKQPGIYPQPGEFFAGEVVPNQVNGKIYVAMGKYTPLLFDVDGWSLKENPARPLTTVQPTVSISAAQIATPPEIALSLRDGAGTAKVARFVPALGEVAMDG